MTPRGFLLGFLLGALSWLGIIAAATNPSLIFGAVFVALVTWGVYEVARSSERAERERRTEEPPRWR